MHNLVCVFARVPAVCTQIPCSEGIALFDVLGCKASADTPISLHRADASYASASPPSKKKTQKRKTVHFNAKWNKIEISHIEVQPGDVSTKRQNHTLYLGR